jgi:amidohydrolase
MIMRTALVSALLLSLPAYADLPDAIDRAAADVESDVIAWRRDIHQHPELSNREERTAALVARHLKSLGIDVKTGIAHTGVVGVIRGGKPGGIVALRADMDALPVVEQTGLPYASTVKATYLGKEVGVMHACGHDAHTAMLMGVATVLAGIRKDLPGTVKLIFQPAEEGAPPGEEGGAALMVREGVLDDPAPTAIFGLHVGQEQAVGEAAYRPEGMMASGQRFEIHVKGRQTHGAAPWAGIDPIVVGAQIVTALQTIVSRRVDVTAGPAVVTVGTFQAGTRNNIVPEEAVLTGTIRTLDPETSASVQRQLRDIATGVATSLGASAEVTIEDVAKLTYNDPALASKMRPTLARIYGAANVHEAPRVTVAEDFSEYQQKIPGLFFFIGVRPRGVPQDQAVPNHSPRFFTDEAALRDGVRAMANLAVDYLEAGN